MGTSAGAEEEVPVDKQRDGRTRSDRWGERPQRPTSPINERARLAIERARAVSSQDEVISLYAEWAKDYDRDVFGGAKIVGPASLARRLSNLVDADAVVLDAGCGTGAVGSHLAASGFAAVDGLDVSAEMLDVAERKSVYRTLMRGDLLSELAIDDATYDAVVSAGTFVSGHVGAAALRELVRVVRPGGVLVFNVMPTFWDSGDFEAVIARLVEDGSVVVSNVDVEPITVDESQSARTIVLKRQ
jgi:ubiquinone/menaquinone biosynthesis C-methylase UbiE